MMRPRTLLLAVATIAMTLLAVEVSARAYSYYLGESVEYQGHGCGNSSANLPYYLNAIGASLDSAGWKGLYYVKDGDWPQVYVDACMQPDGFDIIADSFDLVIEAHHGSIGNFFFGYPSPTGRCSVSLKNDMRLGSMFGARASTAVFGSCCTLNKNYITDTANWQWTRQNLGFHDITEFDNGMFADWFNATRGPLGTLPFTLTNLQAWFYHFEDRPGWFTGDNSPMVISYGTSASDAQNTHATARLGGGVLVSPRGGGPTCGGGQPLFYYYYTYVDHGNSGC